MNSIRNFKKFLLILAAIAIVIILIATYITHSTNDFHRAYESYSSLAKTHADLAYVPGIPENPIRGRLNAILSKVLAKPMTPSERLDLARQGLETLKDGEKQIDDIGDQGEKVQNAIRYLVAKKDSPGSILVRSEADKLIALAKEEFGYIADIRGLSYRANFHTAEIFNRIILDKGALTTAFTNELNRQIPDVEEQFNKRANLYIQLKNVLDRTQKESASM